MSTDVDRYQHCKVFEYRGRKMILLNPLHSAAQARFQFGIEKAKLILACMTEIEAFLADQGKQDHYGECEAYTWKGYRTLCLNPREELLMKKVAFGLGKAGVLVAKKLALLNFVMDNQGGQEA